MARAVWKGPFVEESLMKKVDKYKVDPKKIPIKTWSRKSTIIPDFVGVSFLIYNGKKFIPITVSEDMVGHKLGEFAPTRTFFGHTPADKKAKPAEAEAAEGEADAEGVEAAAAEGGDKPAAEGDKKEGEDKKPAEEKK